MPLPKAAKQFNEHAREHDDWYDTSPLFAIELEAIRAVKMQFMRPGLEISVGPGHFASALDIEFGLDPPLSPLQLARDRSIISINGIGEQLPVRTQPIGTVFLFLPFAFSLIRQLSSGSFFVYSSPVDL